jgi:hypothetical protein
MGKCCCAKTTPFVYIVHVTCMRHSVSIHRRFEACHLTTTIITTITTRPLKAASRGARCPRRSAVMKKRWMISRLACSISNTSGEEDLIRITFRNIKRIRSANICENQVCENPDSGHAFMYSVVFKPWCVCFYQKDVASAM